MIFEFFIFDQNMGKKGTKKAQNMQNGELSVEFLDKKSKF